MPGGTTRDPVIDLVRVLCVVIVVVGHMLMIGAAVVPGPRAGGRAHAARDELDRPGHVDRAGHAAVLRRRRLRRHRRLAAPRGLRRNGGRLHPLPHPPARAPVDRPLRRARARHPRDAPHGRRPRVRSGSSASASHRRCGSSRPTRSRRRTSPGSRRSTPMAPWRTLATLAAGAMIFDVLRFATGVEALGLLNMTFVWLFAQQLGFWIADGWFQASRRRHDRGDRRRAYLLLFGLVAIGYPGQHAGQPQSADVRHRRARRRADVPAGARASPARPRLMAAATGAVRRRRPSAPA